MKVLFVLLSVVALAAAGGHDMPMDMPGWMGPSMPPAPMGGMTVMFNNMGGGCCGGMGGYGYSLADFEHFMEEAEKECHDALEHTVHEIVEHAMEETGHVMCMIYKAACGFSPGSTERFSDMKHCLYTLHDIHDEHAANDMSRGECIHEALLDATREGNPNNRDDQCDRATGLQECARRL
eukprot:TRINITY_DN61195_c0_g1_i1.p1 TRINITY_DN61195_c0_g1~~TRINITY_DN61195_c0_g1_i1.p1  ORF type:complete len:180 (-),score=32.68 TRINITY_DN61195_c0_g1_i1:250-789(-)